MSLLGLEKAVIALALTALLQDCAISIDLVHRFELTSCPDETFSLPEEVEQPPYRLSSEIQDERVSAPEPSSRAIG